MQERFRGEAVEFDDFVARFVAADEFDAIPGAIEFFGEQLEQGLVGGGIDGRGGDFDFQFRAGRADDLIGRGARLEFDGEQSAVRLGAEERRSRHSRGIIGGGKPLARINWGIEREDGAVGAVK